MGSQVVNLFVIIAVGVILADMIANYSGTQALFNGIANIWTISVNGMLGQPTSGTSGTTTATPTGTLV